MGEWLRRGLAESMMRAVRVMGVALLLCYFAVAWYFTACVPRDATGGP